MNEKIKVLVVSHKPAMMPREGMYLPIFVGPAKEAWSGKMQKDDEGENIADKNSQYSELTALYWAWKNLSAEYIGVVHYRRYMSINKCKSLNNILSKEEAIRELSKNEILVVKPRLYLETIKKHFVHCHKTMKIASARQIEILGDVIKEDSSEYAEAFLYVMNKHSAHMYNMFIMSKADLNEYCSWMFPILFETERRIDKEGILFERLMGSLSEFLLDTWLIKNRKSYKNLKLYQTEMGLLQRIKRFVQRRYLEK